MEPMPEPTAKARRALQRLTSELADVGFALPGSLTERHMRCGKPGCRCKADPPQLHGPYLQWTRKVGGKTVTVRLSDAQAKLLRRWLHNAKGIDCSRLPRRNHP